MVASPCPAKCQQLPGLWSPLRHNNVYKHYFAEMDMRYFLESLALFLDACRFMVSKVSGGKVRNLGIQNISHVI
jgi:hypothetical protein